MPLVEKRYAEALIRVGLKLNTLDIFQKELIGINEVINANQELKKFLNNPGFSSKDKKTVLEKLFKKDLNPNVYNFLKLLIDKGRIKNISDIISQYIALADEIRKCLNIEVITPEEVTKEQLSKIGDKFKKQYGSMDVKIKHRIDPKIIGGVIVKIGDKMIDGSIKGKLDGMLSVLNQA